MNAAMRGFATSFMLLLVACGDGTRAVDVDAGQLSGPTTYDFGPYTLAPSEEDTSKCVQISLNNDQYANVNVVELTTGPGFHHSNWFFVPDFTFPGDDGTYTCKDRGFDQAIAAIKGGVFFAQSTQAPHEVQQFPAGTVVRIPPHHKLVAQIHLLNATDTPLSLAPSIKVTYLPDAQVTTRLAGVSFENVALALPPNMQSKFTVECDFSELHQHNLQRPPDFKLYYTLGHYHELGTRIDVEAVKPTGESAVIYTTEARVGDSMGGMLDPAFDFTGYTKIRFSCEYYNNRATTVGWGVGDQEMCVFLAFSDSTYNWGGGVVDAQAPENPLMVGNTMTYSNPCTLFANDADRG